ncbi:nicotinate-nucleotide adenylyltransferase [Algibacillus agarilyticus]|uniref:nicotinate-nucleotide adenylyltransferase n=1 Tax=Algibacillus agarilyticus TaxID=2234133 RepID=UPI000DD0D987|nr:nicotinate-nucleotide adenylyltransferase [Algibacillus agarilyticus]
MKPILLFGGTFDPIHFGHIQPALEIAEALDAEHVCLLPNRIPPHKATPNIADQDRLNMCELVVEMFDCFSVNDMELRAERVSYTYDSLVELSTHYGKQPLCFVIGMDSLNTLHTWHNWQHLTEFAHLIVMKRGGCEMQLTPEVRDWLALRKTTKINDIHDKPNGHVLLFDTSELMISSTYIKQRFNQKLDCRCLIPAPVNDYIVQQQLYQN